MKTVKNRTKGYDPDTDRYVAIKILPQHFSHDPQFRERFKREAKAIAKLEHLHILPIFAYGEEEGIAYMAMRYLQGGTLTDQIVQGSLAFSEAERILRQLASALDHAHSQNILHRDMKPSNVLLDDAGNAYLMDFGIAKIVEATVDLTGDRLLGTPAYMSPEQCKGEPIGPASDIYSLGIILYEMVTGRRPFHAETPIAVILQQLNDPLPPPRQARPDLPEKAETVIFKALAKNPESRYKTASDSADAFSQAIATADTAVSFTRPASPSEPEPTPPPVEPETAAMTVAPQSQRRLPAWAWGLIGVLAAAALITLGIFLANRGGDDKTPPVADVAVATAVPRDEPAAPRDDKPEPVGQAPSVPLPPVPKCLAGQTELFFDDFEDGNFNGWDLSDANGRPSTGGWHVIRQDDNHVLVGSGHNWAHAPATFGQDYVLHLRLHQDNAASWHLNVRMGEDGRYYVSPEALHRDPDEIELARWPFHPDDAWHVVSVLVKGNHVEISWNGRQVAAVDDPEPLKAGIVALKNTGATVWYDDIRVCALPGPGPTAGDAPAPSPNGFHFVDSGQRLGQPSCGRSSDVGDLNGDGAPDIFITHNIAQQTWLNDGHGRFTKEAENLTDGPEDICSNQAVLGDLDDDGDLDAVVGIFLNDSVGDNIIWLNDGQGRFSDSGQDWVVLTVGTWPWVTWTATATWIFLTPAAAPAKSG